MYTASSERYDTMVYNRCGKSGLLLPAVSLGLWHNFGTNADPENMKAMLLSACVETSRTKRTFKTSFYYGQTVY